MTFSPITGSLLLVLGLSVVLIVTGLKMRPGIGIISAVLIILSVMWARKNGLADLGLQFSINWTSTILKALGYSILISLLSMALIEPLSEILTKTVHDLGPAEKIRGNGLELMQTLVFVWLFVAIVEEIIFRGFLMIEISNIIGSGWIALTINIIFTSIVFGLCHAYQNKCGMLTTGLIGSLLAMVFLISGKNLWMAILTHGFIDTIGLLAIYFRADKFLSQLLWKS